MKKDKIRIKELENKLELEKIYIEYLEKNWRDMNQKSRNDVCCVKELLRQRKMV